MLVKVPLSWLSKYCEIPWGAQELSDRLTMSLLEVDDVLTVGLSYENMVVGHVLSAEKHPNADRLSLCTVDVGTETLEIVCGAPNVAAGQRVAVALIGARVAGEMKIKKSKIRGVVSRGMICSEAELNLSDEADGIMVLDSEITIGTPLVNILGASETVLAVDVGTNRPDCLALTGVAREVAALSGTNATMPDASVSETGPPIETLASVSVEDTADCTRFVGRVITGVSIGPSPRWIARRLEAAGIRSINNVVDVTNYVMLEMGQPLHAYDLNTLAGRQIGVRRAKDEVAFTTLDGVERKLSSEVLMISDRDRNIGVAGVMGGLNTEISDTTTDVFLEGACFHAVRVRRSSKILGLKTDASLRFERGMDPELQGLAVARAAQFIAELAGGDIAKGAIDVRGPIDPPVTVTLRPSRANQLLGTNIDQGDMLRTLETLGFTVEGTDNLVVNIPSFRRDITREADLIEEIARLYGYDRLEPVMSRPNPIDLHQVDHARQTRQALQDVSDHVTSSLRDILIGNGCLEVMTHSFSNPADLLALNEDETFVAVDNPISREYAVLRTTLAANVLNLVRWNANRKADNIRVFELGRIFTPAQDAPLPHESRQLCVAVTGNREDPHWGQKDTALDFFDIKGIVQSTLEPFGLDKAESVQYDEKHELFDLERSASLVIDGRTIGSYGLVVQRLADYFDIAESVWIYLLDCDYLMELGTTKRAYQTLPKYPAVERDLALVVSEHVQHQSVSNVLRETCGELLESVDLFDVYRGDPVPQGKKSLAYALRYRSPDRTLTDEDVASLQQDAIARLGSLYDAELR